MNMYSIFDVKSATYLAPFFVSDDIEALELYHAAIEEQQTHIGLFELIRLGTWEPELGNFNTFNRQKISEV